MCGRPRPSVYREIQRAGQGGLITSRKIRNTRLALRLGHVESGVDVAEITRLTSHFSCRTIETIYRRELRTPLTADTCAMDRIGIQPGAPVRGV
jgi:hypothetical protein